MTDLEMADLEDELRELLNRRSQAGSVGNDDWVDLRHRITARRRRKGAMVASALVALVIALPAAGIVIARAVDRSSPGVGPARSATPAATPSSSPGTSGDACTSGSGSGTSTTTTDPQAPFAGCGASEPTMPAAGVQPPNSAAAREEVTAAFSDAYAGGLASTGAGRAAIQDGDSLAGLVAQVQAGPQAQLVAQSTAKVRDVVFTSPSSAAVSFGIYLAGKEQGTAKLGAAILLDGRWRVTRDTACTDLAQVGALCPGFTAVQPGG